MNSLNRFWVGLVLVAVASLANAEFQAGDDYERIEPAQTPAVDEGQIEVVEIFWYGCPHCYRLEPSITRWKENLPDDVAFRRVPGILNPQWAEHARAFYTAEALDMVDEIHRPLFQAIHQQERRMQDFESLQAFFVDHGADPDEVRQAWGSFSVASNVRSAQELGQAYGMDHVPAVAVDGRFWTSPSIAGGEERFYDVLEHLLERARE